MAVAGGVGFSFGANYGLNQAQTIRNDFFQQRGGLPPGQGMPSGNFPGMQAGQGQAVQGAGVPDSAMGRPGNMGTVKSVNGKIIQLTSPDGTTINVQTDDKTVIQKPANGTLADIQPNMRIAVTGDASNGTITARMIQITVGGQ